jgi:hypothetical protein
MVWVSTISSFFSPPLSFFDFFFVFAPVDTQYIVSKTVDFKFFDSQTDRQTDRISIVAVPGHNGYAAVPR